MSEYEWVPTTREDYSPMQWRNRVKAAKLKVKIDQRLGKPSEDWVLELAAEPLPGAAAAAQAPTPGRLARPLSGRGRPWPTARPRPGRAARSAPADRPRPPA